MAKGKKTGGREPGTPNRLTRELRAALKDIIYHEIAGLPARFETLQDKDRIELLTKFLPFLLPKIKEVFDDHNEPMNYSEF